MRTRDDLVGDRDELVGHGVHAQERAGDRQREGAREREHREALREMTGFRAEAGVEAS